MKTIILDRAKKIMLIEALRRGSIDREEVMELFPMDMSEEEITAELEKFWAQDYEEICESLKRRGLCDCQK